MFFLSDQAVMGGKTADFFLQFYFFAVWRRKQNFSDFF